MHSKRTAFQRCAQTAIALLVPLTPAMSAAVPCEDLLNLQLPDATITEAALDTSGEFDPPPPAPPITGLPPFCRVVGVAQPTNTSMIGFEVWMPTETWNNKFEGVGSGGSLGSIGYTALADGLTRGYSTMANDNGHTGSTWTFAQFPEKVIDFGYRAQHVTTQLGKLVTEAFYGAGPAHSYFVGCSQGGHHALMELQRYPGDYDGIVGMDLLRRITALAITTTWSPPSEEEICPWRKCKSSLVCSWSPKWATAWADPGPRRSTRSTRWSTGSRTESPPRGFSPLT